MGNNATACRASEVSTGSDTLRSKPTRSRDEPIKTVGTHLVPAKLHAEVEFPITVEVVPS